MIRAVKFRAWDRDQKLMLYPGNGKWFMVEPDQEHIVIEVHNKPATNGCFETVIARQFYGTLLQYTGLRDRNGVEIWEGDVAHCDLDGPFKTETVTGVIEIKEPLSVWVDFPQHGTAIQIEGFNDDSFEVIGNFYEHPELLEDNE